MGDELAATGEKPAPRRSRKWFVRQIGVTLMAALGAGALAKTAFATVNCCVDASCGSCTTINGQPGIYCSCDAAGGCTQICLSSGCTGCPARPPARPESRN